MQNRFLFYPDRYDGNILEGELKKEAFCAWPSREDYRGIIPPDFDSTVKGTVLVFHGNAGSALDRTFYIEPLRSLGYRVILLEYPGYGPRGGTLSEKTLIADGVHSVELAAEQFSGPLYILGESLGCGVAAGVIHQAASKIQGAILITPWDNLTSVAQSLYWFLPVKYLVKDKYDSVGYLQNFHGPYALVVAEHDELIPAKSSQRLYESLRGTKKLWLIPNAGHNTWIDRTHSAWWREMMDFLVRSR